MAELKSGTAALVNGNPKSRFVFGFAEDVGILGTKELLGNKGVGLMRMTQLGFPVPEGFTIGTEACVLYMRLGSFPPRLMDEVMEKMRALEEATGQRFGDPENPLLVAVRSGAPVSMPGMMDTVLDLGLNDATAEGMARTFGDERFVYDSYRRFVQMFGEVVLKAPSEEFEDAIERVKEERGVELDTELTTDDLKRLVAEFKEIVARGTDRPFPEDAVEQLELSIRAVFDSWLNERAVAYRNEYHIPESVGTGVIVQRMVFGNTGQNSGTGVAFTRNPATGEHGVFGEFLLDAQGEDVVAGIRTPRPLQEMEDDLPDAYRQLLQTMVRLEREYRDMQDVEFTVEHDKLYMLQTRNGKRTAAAALKIARDMVQEGLITREEALARLRAEDLDQFLHPRIDPDASYEVVGRGLAASPGAATGKVVLTAGEAEQLGRAGEDVLLVRKETSPDDVGGMIAARGILTAQGGMTSHAAVVARAMGKPAVCGCKDLSIDHDGGKISVGGRTFAAGDILTIEGARGEVIAGEVPLIEPEVGEDFEEVLRWADERRILRVRANADTPEEARQARRFGAEGIGLCRTEHMFMEHGRLDIMRRMILAEDEEELREALEQLEPLQQADFEEIFATMEGLPVTVRLLDPPLHEFLPNEEQLKDRLGGLDPQSSEAEELRHVLGVVEQLTEANPMLGMRGVRVGILRPEIYKMQARAIVRAARTAREAGHDTEVEIMIPLVGFPEELVRMRALVEEEIGRTRIPVGTMIELPRACAVADEVARDADFFSFGTNDLTQTVCGMSRDDAQKNFLGSYIEGGIMEYDPFERLDQEGVGKMIALASDLGRSTKPGLGLGVCGEHGGDPSSIGFFHRTGFDYVSCSPFRVPVARLAAAQAAIKDDHERAAIRAAVKPAL